MTRDELLDIVKRNNTDTLVAARMRKALGLRPPDRKRGHVRDKSAKPRRYRGARRLMKQRHGVRM